uniref:Uncharacterized protein n=1 Tax=Arundo donax TaxID=35708 RepID=A0A0A8ZN17_ARUDO
MLGWLGVPACAQPVRVRSLRTNPCVSLTIFSSCLPRCVRVCV